MFRPSNELKLANPHAVVHSPAAVSFLLISLSIFSLWGFLFCALYVGSSGRAQVFYLSPLGRDQVEDTVFSCKKYTRGYRAAERTIRLVSPKALHFPFVADYATVLSLTDSFLFS